MAIVPFLMNIRPYSVTLLQYFSTKEGETPSKTVTLKPFESIAEAVVLVTDQSSPAYNEPLIKRYLDESILTRIMVPIADPVIPDVPIPAAEIYNLVYSIDGQSVYDFEAATFRPLAVVKDKICLVDEFLTCYIRDLDGTIVHQQDISAYMTDQGFKVNTLSCNNTEIFMISRENSTDLYSKVDMLTGTVTPLKTTASFLSNLSAYYNGDSWYSIKNAFIHPDTFDVFLVVSIGNRDVDNLTILGCRITTAGAFSSTLLGQWSNVGGVIDFEALTGVGNALYEPEKLVNVFVDNYSWNINNVPIIFILWAANDIATNLGFKKVTLSSMGPNWDYVTGKDFSQAAVLKSLSPFELYLLAYKDDWQGNNQLKFFRIDDDITAPVVTLIHSHDVETLSWLYTQPEFILLNSSKDPAGFELAITSLYPVPTTNPGNGDPWNSCGFIREYPSIIKVPSYEPVTIIDAYYNGLLSYNGKKVKVNDIAQLDEDGGMASAGIEDFPVFYRNGDDSFLVWPRLRQRPNQGGGGGE